MVLTARLCSIALLVTDRASPWSSRPPLLPAALGFPRSSTRVNRRASMQEMADTHLDLDAAHALRFGDVDRPLHGGPVAVHREAHVVLLLRQAEPDAAVPRLLDKVARGPRAQAVEREALLERMGLRRVRGDAREARGGVAREARRRHRLSRGRGDTPRSSVRALESASGPYGQPGLHSAALQTSPCGGTHAVPRNRPPVSEHRDARSVPMWARPRPAVFSCCASPARSTGAFARPSRSRAASAWRRQHGGRCALTPAQYDDHAVSNSEGGHEAKESGRWRPASAHAMGDRSVGSHTHFTS